MFWAKVIRHMHFSYIILRRTNLIILKEPRGNLIKYFYVKWVLRGYISTMYNLFIEKHNIRIIKMNCYRYQYLWKTWNIDFWISYNWKIIWNSITKIYDKIHLYLSSKLVYNYYNVKSKYAWPHWQFFFQTRPTLGLIKLQNLL